MAKNQQEINDTPDFYPHKFVAKKLGLTEKQMIIMCSEKTEPYHAPKIIDRRDIFQFSNKTYTIKWEPWNAAGMRYPRILDRREWLKTHEVLRKKRKKVLNVL